MSFSFLSDTKIAEHITLALYPVAMGMEIEM
jgi:hypothetical protein